MLAAFPRDDSAQAVIPLHLTPTVGQYGTGLNFDIGKALWGMVIDTDEVSQTIPRRGASRDPARIAVLLLAGTGAVRSPTANPTQSRVIPVGSGLDIGRRPPPPTDGHGA